MTDNSFLNDYENMPLIRYDEIKNRGLKTVNYSELADFEGGGVLKACYYDGSGNLVQHYTEEGNHVCVIAATRLGKTTSYVIPTILSFAKQKVKKSMIVTDPKGEIYRLTASTLRESGYKVKLLNFRDYRHSEFWNPFTPIFTKFKRAQRIFDEVELVTEDGEPKNKFRGKVYTSQEKLNRDIEFVRQAILDDVDNDIDNLANMMIALKSQKDPTWEIGARDLLRGFIHAMLEDSLREENPITEDTFSIDTIFRVLATFSDEADEYDGGYFSDREKTSKAYMLVKDVLFIAAKVTRAGYVSTFNSCMSTYREMITRKITSFNSFDFSELVDEPTVLFISFRDELKASYNTITLFVQDAYRYMIERASQNKNGKLEVPFYFILDEFGNFAEIKDFETTISACAGRNIWFILIVQSFAQLNAVYGEAVSEIIRDNLNVHIFFGSNNPKTLQEFSQECGSRTRLSPLSALNGSTTEIDKYELETIPLITKTRLSHFEVGECTITEANSGYVMLSRLERYYLCKEFTCGEECALSDYESAVDFTDDRFVYDVSKTPRKPKSGRSSWDF